MATFRMHATIAVVRNANGSSRLGFDVPNSDIIEVAKMLIACQEEPLIITVETEPQETIGGASNG